MDSDNEEITFKINKEFADKYESNKRGQELSASMLSLFRRCMGVFFFFFFFFFFDLWSSVCRMVSRGVYKLVADGLTVVYPAFFIL
jgi:hypothetical protein